MKLVRIKLVFKCRHQTFYRIGKYTYFVKCSALVPAGSPEPSLYILDSKKNDVTNDIPPTINT